ncbi:hypothetical protein PHSC3_000621 [Chlamydiales bacterium STE3]|nr:hypothetical protein PHSC3_000621 [Chlamydiales bacterium STE3]
MLAPWSKKLVYRNRKLVRQYSFEKAIEMLVQAVMASGLLIACPVTLPIKPIRIQIGLFRNRKLA